MSNSTFANNSTNGVYNGGGGIAGGSPLTITNCTIVDNSNGGISNGNMTINNTIVAGNTGYDISGQIIGNNNLIGSMGLGITNLSNLNTSNLVERNLTVDLSVACSLPALGGSLSMSPARYRS